MYKYVHKGFKFNITSKYDLHNIKQEINGMPNRKILLDEEQIPKQWYNITPDLPKPLPPFIDAETKEPGAGIVPRIFPKAILGQEMSKDRWIDIPEEVREIYRM